MSGRRARRGGGFTLLEVLVAVAILGLGLTAVLSAQTGLFASSARVEKVSFATGLARCRMNEIEVELLKNGYPLTDTDEEGVCCNDEPAEGFSCAWAIDRVTLPEAPTMDEVLASTSGTGEDEDQSGGLLGGGSPTASPLGSGAAPSPTSLGPLGALNSIGQSQGSALGDNPTLSSLAGMMGGSMGGGASAMVPMVMGMVYPQLKPMLEASIRRITVTVIWKQGSRERELVVQQFVTNPQMGGFNPLAAQAGAGAAGAAAGGGATGGGATGGAATGFGSLLTSPGGLQQ